MELLIGLIVLLALMYGMGWALQDDLKRMEKNDPKYRKYLKDRYGW